MAELTELAICIKDEFVHLFCGNKIGNGSNRIVYELETDSTKVVKIETSSSTFQNVIEWKVWQEVMDTKWAKWFAPCHFISHSGSILIQDKVHPITESQLPDKIPSFFTDLKINNYGIIGKQLVARDYGHNLLMANGLNDKMKKAYWR